MIEISIEYLKSITDRFSYQTHGDDYEIYFNRFVIDIFSNSEYFWKLFITPSTNRINHSIIDRDIQLQPRIGIDKGLFDLFVVHYSIFKNLVYAAECINNKHISYYQNFYTHLGTVLDLAEEFNTLLYFIILECENKETKILQKLKKDEFLKIAGEWFEKHYAGAFEHYLSKGKTAPIKIIGRSNILDEYFGNLTDWKNYKSFANQVRFYRNVIVHNSEIGSLKTENEVFVPKKEKIGDYKKWYQIQSMDEQAFAKDFIEINNQMKDDFEQIKTALNNLWNFSIQYFNRLFYIENNKILMDKYKIQIKQSNGL